MALKVAEIQEGWSAVVVVLSLYTMVGHSKGRTKSGEAVVLLLMTDYVPLADDL